MFFASATRSCFAPNAIGVRDKMAKITDPAGRSKNPRILGETTILHLGILLVKSLAVLMLMVRRRRSASAEVEVNFAKVTSEKLLQRSALEVSFLKK